MTRDYFNSKAHIWDEVIAEKDQEKLKYIADRMDIKSGSTVLDVGTGTGIFIPFLLKKIGENGRLICLDFAAEMLNEARSKGFTGTIEYICADVTHSGIQGGICDAVVCYSSFPHFQDKAKVLKEINRILKENGKLFICHSSNRDIINEMHSQIAEVCNHLIPSDSEIRHMLTSQGFTGIKIESTDTNFLITARKFK